MAREFYDNIAGMAVPFRQFGYTFSGKRFRRGGGRYYVWSHAYKRPGPRKRMGHRCGPGALSGWVKRHLSIIG